MKNFKPTDVCEMRRRFALAEIDSDVLKQTDTTSPNAKRLPREEKERLKNMLMSDNSRDVCNAISEHVHGGYVYRNFIVPKVVKDWYVAQLDATLDEFKRLRVINTPSWGFLSNGTYELSIAANNPMIRVKVPRIKEIISIVLNGGSINLTGITLICGEGEKTEGPWTIVEGHARLVTIYLQLNGHLPTQCKYKEIEVVLGVC